MATKDAEDLASLQKYFKLADELQGLSVIIAYYIKTYAVTKGFEIFKSSKQQGADKLNDQKILDEWFNDIETLRQQIGPQDKEKNKVDYINFVYQLFLKCDNEYREGTFTVQTAQLFMNCGLLFDAYAIFGPLDQEIIQKRKYAKLKAVEIKKTLLQQKKPATEEAKPAPVQQQQTFNSTPQDYNMFGDIKKSQPLAKPGGGNDLDDMLNNYTATGDVANNSYKNNNAQPTQNLYQSVNNMFQPNPNNLATSIAVAGPSFSNTQPYGSSQLPNNIGMSNQGLKFPSSAPSGNTGFSQNPYNTGNTPGQNNSQIPGSNYAMNFTNPGPTTSQKPNLIPTYSNTQASSNPVQNQFGYSTPSGNFGGQSTNPVPQTTPIATTANAAKLKDKRKDPSYIAKVEKAKDFAKKGVAELDYKRIKQAKENLIEALKLVEELDMD
jgi:hypothetical protein